ncbi:YihY/virulence factor BrkB family protein [Methylomonas koyamae]|uniref:YihY/virulence factor BrkB family protein n=1 Tax=Methylomonas koyamae TaxID=702114 RepID=UPI000BC3133B|nr:YihY/virulence factor BrkB family protein [Methylomonas koyamae]ATG88903.1 ribonuclease BN [Methylomonas koyamae]
MAMNLLLFCKEDIWRLDERSLAGWPALCVRCVKIALLAVQGFRRDLCQLRASALTLYSILSIVPVIAMLFGIAKGFGFEKLLQRQLLERAPQQDELMLRLIGFAQNLLAKTQGEVVAGIGIAVLFWTVVSLIANIEESFNFIWKIEQGRSWSRKCSDYLSLMLLGPVLLMAASGLTVFLQTQVGWLAGAIHLPAFGVWLVLKALGLSPLLLMIVLFTVVFVFMPNHAIDYRAGLVAGVVTGLLYHGLQWAYLSLQIGVSSYNAIYGSFAALPLFVVWLQSCWIIVLFGCEMAFYIQNYPIHRHGDRFGNLSFSLKKILALQITHALVKRFLKQEAPPSAEELARDLMIPLALVQALLNKLIASRIVVEFCHPEQTVSVFQPAVDINILSIGYVVDALECCGQNQLPDIQPQQDFAEAVDHFRQAMADSAGNRLLKNI